MPMVKSILKTEKIIGLDPWLVTTKALFEVYLEKLSQSQVYQAMVDQHTAVELST